MLPKCKNVKTKFGSINLFDIIGSTLLLKFKKCTNKILSALIFCALQ